MIIWDQNSLELSAGHFFSIRIRNEEPCEIMVSLHSSKHATEARPENWSNTGFDCCCFRDLQSAESDHQFVWGKFVQCNGSLYWHHQHSLFRLSSSQYIETSTSYHGLHGIPTFIPKRYELNVIPKVRNSVCNIKLSACCQLQFKSNNLLCKGS